MAKIHILICNQTPFNFRTNNSVVNLWATQTENYLLVNKAMVLQCKILGYTKRNLRHLQFKRQFILISLLPSTILKLKKATATKAAPHARYWTPDHCIIGENTQYGLETRSLWWLRCSHSALQNHLHKNSRWGYSTDRDLSGIKAQHMTINLTFVPRCLNADLSKIANLTTHCVWSL